MRCDTCEEGSDFALQEEDSWTSDTRVFPFDCCCCCLQADSDAHTHNLCFWHVLQCASQPAGGQRVKKAVSHSFQEQLQLRRKNQESKDHPGGWRRWHLKYVNLINLDAAHQVCECKRTRYVSNWIENAFKIMHNVFYIIFYCTFNIILMFLSFFFKC